MSSEDTQNTPPAPEEASGDPPARELGVREAADFLGVSVRRLHHLRRQGAILARRVGWRRGWRFREPDLMAHVERTAGVPAASMSPTASLPVPSTKDEEFAFVADSPIVRLVNAIIVRSIEERATDIHIEPVQSELRVRMRIDGILVETTPIPKHVQAPIIARVKVMADVDVVQRAIPQVGTIPIKHNDTLYNLRVSVMPTRYGEALAVHVLGAIASVGGLSGLGFAPETRSMLEDLITQPSGGGLILVAGPPGSGLTTTAATMLWKVLSITTGIYTFEETPEYIIGGISHTYRNARKGLTLPAWLRALWRHDPDILFLGDVADAEAAACAVEAAAHGVLAIATIAARDSVDALRRLTDWGIAPATTARMLTGIVGQRLARRLCGECKEEYTVPSGELRRFGEPFGSSPEREVTLWRGKGCDACRNKGYLGRIGIFELLRMNEEMAELLVRGAGQDNLREAARANGTQGLRYDILQKILMGMTTPHEAVRVLGHGREPMV